MKIKEGDKLLCIKDVVMTKSGKTMYYAGKVYQSEDDDCITNEEGMKTHVWYEDDKPEEHFKLINELTDVEKFQQISAQICKLYEAKNAVYGNSFGDTYKKLGIVSAVTRISDKYNRLCNLATNPDIDNLGESIDDTLRDMASYCIMTVIELEKKPNVINQDDIIKILAEIYHMADDAKNKIARDTLNSKSLNDLVNELISKTLDSAKTVLPEKNLS